MGLIKAAKGAIGSTLHDQWKDVIRCEDMSNDILMMKKSTPTGVISNGSTIIVAPGQIAVIFDNGRILDATAEDGMYTFNDSSTPSFFAGQFGETFKEMWQRFTYNGTSSKQQAVIYFNTKEIMDNKFGTPAPVLYKDWGHAIMNARTNSYIAMSVEVKCFGKYTFRIENPALFMSKVTGIVDMYKKQELIEQIRSEVIGAFSNVMNSLGSDENKIEVLELPNKTDEIKTIMDENIFDQPIRNRGITLVSFVVESLTLSDDSKSKINTYELGADTYQQQGVLTNAYSNAIQDAAKNDGGAINGFMGIGMMNMASNNMFGCVTNNTAKPMEPQEVNMPAKSIDNAIIQDNTKTWKCTNCEKENISKFCTECGKKKSEEQFCTKCKSKLDSKKKFCPECGTKVEK